MMGRGDSAAVAITSTITKNGRTPRERQVLALLDEPSYLEVEDIHFLENLAERNWTRPLTEFQRRRLSDIARFVNLAKE